MSVAPDQELKITPVELYVALSINEACRQVGCAFEKMLSELDKVKGKRLKTTAIVWAHLTKVVSDEDMDAMLKGYYKESYRKKFIRNTEKKFKKIAPYYVLHEKVDKKGLWGYQAARVRQEDQRQNITLNYPMLNLIKRRKNLLI